MGWPGPPTTRCVVANQRIFVNATPGRSAGIDERVWSLTLRVTMYQAPQLRAAATCRASSESAIASPAAKCTEAELASATDTMSVSCRINSSDLSRPWPDNVVRIGHRVPCHERGVTGPFDVVQERVGLAGMACAIQHRIQQHIAIQQYHLRYFRLSA